MGVIITATFGLCLWIVLWATQLFNGLDGIIIAGVMVLIALAVQNLLPFLPGRRD
jgi:multisubunit Na+/H+ antiporter MnhB subunit